MSRRDPRQQQNLDGYNAPPIPWERVHDHQPRPVEPTGRRILRDIDGLLDAAVVDAAIDPERPKPRVHQRSSVHALVIDDRDEGRPQPHRGRAYRDD